MFALALVNVDADGSGDRRRHHHHHYHPGGPHPRPTPTVDPINPTGPIPSTLTSARTNPSRDNVDIGQRRYKTTPGEITPNRERPVSDDNVRSGQRRCRSGVLSSRSG